MIEDIDNQPDHQVDEAVNRSLHEQVQSTETDQRDAGELGRTAVDSLTPTEVMNTEVTGGAENTPARKVKEGPEEALARISAGDARGVAYGLKGYKGLTNEVAMALIDAGQGGAIIWYPNKFSDLDHDAAIMRMVTDKDDEINKRREQLLKAGYGPRDWQIRELDDKRKYAGVMHNLYKFTLTPKTLAELESRGHKSAVASYRAGKVAGRGLVKEQRLRRTLATLDY